MKKITVLAALAMSVFFVKSTYAAVTVSAPIVAIPHVEIEKIASPFGNWFDSPISSFRVGTTQYWIKADSYRMAKASGPLDAPFSKIDWNDTTANVMNVPPVLDVLDGSRRGYWMVNTYQNSSGILGFVHVEVPKVDAAGKYDTGKSRIGLAWSTDNGNKFRYIGDILGMYGDPATTNVQGSPYIIRDGYFYTYFTDMCGNAVARAKVSDVIDAAKRGRVTSWKKYFNGKWDSVGISGNCTSIGVPGITHSDAAYSTHTKKYYLITSTMNWFGQDTWIKLFESSNGINWTFVKTIVQQPASEVKMGYQYTTIVKTDGKDNGEVGRTFYIYGQRDPETNASVFYRWTVNLDGRTDASSTVPPKTLYQVSADFSQTQGAGQWSYEYRTGTTYTQMLWGNAPYDAAKQLWNGNEEFLLMDKGWLHPGAASDAVLSWKAPRPGKVRIYGAVSDSSPACGNGVNVIILRNTTQLSNYSISNADTQGIKHDITTSVAVNDSIRFIVNSRDNDNSCDTTNWTPTVEYIN